MGGLRGWLWHWTTLGGLTLMIGCLLWLAPSAVAQDATWSGAGLASENMWSNASNWEGAVAPTAGASIGSLHFPRLSPPLLSSDCFGFSPTVACYHSHNDVSGLSVEQLQLDDADPYELSGQALTLGSGGLHADGPAGSGGFATVNLPLTLGASQSWQVSGSPSGGDWLTILGALSGSSSNLNVELSHGGALYVGGFAPSAVDNEIGDVTVASADADQNEAFGLSSSLNASDGHRLTLHGVSFDPIAASTGPLFSIDAITDIGTFAYAPTLEATTGVSTTLTSSSATFDAASTVDLPITGSGTTAGSDYSQLTATGDISLGGASLNISDDFVGGCPNVPLGQTDTIISTSGSLSGSFGNAPDDSTLSTVCLSPQGQTMAGQEFRVNYHRGSSPETVTATAIGASSPTTTFGAEFLPWAYFSEGGVFGTELTFSGSEYHGHVAPLTSLKLHLPTGTVLSTAGFPTCSQGTLGPTGRGPYGCPEGSLAGRGSFTASVAFGSETVDESGSVEAFFGPKEKLFLFFFGHIPVLVELLAEGHLEAASPGRGPVLAFDLPLVETVPGEPIGLTSLLLELGASWPSGGGEVSSITVPPASDCPHGRFSWGAEAGFNNEPATPVATNEGDCLQNDHPRTASSTSLSVSSVSPHEDQAVTFTATVRPEGGITPSGGVTFYEGVRQLAGCTGPVAVTAGVAVASCTTSYGDPGERHIHAVYSGDDNYRGSVTAPTTVTVTTDTPPQDLNWSGSGSSGLWSEAANWLGGVAPASSASLGTLTLPALAGSTTNDLSGLSLNQLQVNDSRTAALSGQPFTLGAGGLAITADPTATNSPSSFQLFTPLTLSASQTWTVGGPLNATQYVEPIAALSGPGANLTITTSAPTILAFGGQSGSGVAHDELGDVTITGTGTSDEGAAFVGTDVLLEDASLNASDGHRLTINQAYLKATQATGPITGHEAVLELLGENIGAVTAESSLVRPVGVLALPSLSLDATSRLTLGLDGTGSMAGSDFDQLQASGTIDLGGSKLELTAQEAVPFSGQCERPSVGSVTTLVSTSGSLSGSFGNAPEGGTVTTNECVIPTAEGSEEAAFPYRITYHRSSSPETVTATALPMVAPEPKPEISTPKEAPKLPPCCDGPPPPQLSAAQIAAQLKRQLVVSSKAARIGSLLKHGGLSLAFTAPEAGTLSVLWFYSPQGAKQAGVGKGKPVLVALGKLVFAGGGTGSVQIRLTGAGRKLLKRSKRLRLSVRASFATAGPAGSVKATGSVQLTAAQGSGHIARLASSRPPYCQPHSYYPGLCEIPKQQVTDSCAEGVAENNGNAVTGLRATYDEAVGSYMVSFSESPTGGCGLYAGRRVVSDQEEVRTGASGSFEPFGKATTVTANNGYTVRRKLKQVLPCSAAVVGSAVRQAVTVRWIPKAGWGRVPTRYKALGTPIVWRQHSAAVGVCGGGGVR